MPLVSDREIGPIQQLPEQVDLPAPVEPSVGEIFGAAFRQENSLVSMANNETSFQDYQTEEGFDPFDQGNLKGYELFSESFINAKSSDHMSAIKQQIDNELEDRQTVASGGLTGFVAMAAAGLTDPIYWPLMAVPGGSVIRGAKTTRQAAMRLGVLGGVSEIPAEAAKQLTQETRTSTDSMIAIGGATILSGILGAAGKALSKSEVDNIAAKLDDVMAETDTPLVAGNAVEAHQSMGAAEVAQLSFEELTPVSVGGLEKIGVSPLLRAENSPSIKTKQLASEMMESATVKQGNVDGKSTIPEGGSAETRIKMWDAGLYQGLKDLDDFYTAYRGGKGATARVVNDFVMRNRAGKMTAKEFREEVGRVARRGDKSTVPEIQQAAESFRKNVFDPLKDGAIAEKLLPPDIDVKTATSYLTRVYNTQKIAAKRPEWDGIVESWLNIERVEALKDLPELVGQASSITGRQVVIEKGAESSALSQALRDVDEVTAGIDSKLAVSVGEISEARGSIDNLKELISKQSLQLKGNEKVEVAISKEFNSVFERLLKFKPDRDAPDFTAAVDKAKKSIDDIDVKIKSLNEAEGILHAEAEKNLTRFLSDRSRGLEKREKAFGQNFNRIETKLSKIRAEIAGKSGEREALIGRLEDKIKKLSTVNKGDKSRFKELTTSITRLKNSFRKASDAVDESRKLFDDTKKKTSEVRESISEKIKIRREAEVELKASKKVSRALSARINKANMGFVGDREIKGIAKDITNNIMGIASGRVPYEIIPNVRGPLKERTFNIPDRLIEDFLESDIDIVSRQYVRTMAPDVELSRLYGNANMEQEIADIADSYEELIDAATTEKARIKLTKKIENDQRDISAMRDRLRGTYRTPDDPNSFFIRSGRVLRDANFVRMLGGMTLSAIPDLARPIAVNGLRPVARGMMALATSPKRFGMAKDEARRAAVGLDMVLNGRAASMAEITDIYNKSSSFERGLRSMSDAFGKMTLMSQWNTSLKSFSGVITQDRILDAVAKVADGKASKSVVKRLAASGIGESQAKAIAAQFKKHGDGGSLNLSNGHLWDDKETLDIFKAAVLKDVDRTIVTPGLGEKPLWTSAEAGKLVFQFKTFAAAAHNKILVADLQYRDAEALNGLLLSVALGTAAYGAKEFVAGREINTDPEKLIVESLDRSGVFGYFWDVNNIVEKMTRGEVGVNKLIGAPPMSRYASRNIMGALLGPSAGTIEDLNAVTGAMAQGEFTESDLRRIRKLMPGQNLFYIRQLLNSIEEDIGAGL